MSTNQLNSEKPSFSDIKAVKQIAKSRNTIYLAQNNKTSDSYALKVFHYEKERISRSYELESRVQLSHPNIISIVDAQPKRRDQHGNLFSYILLEYAPYGDLTKLLLKEKMTEDTTLIRTLFHQLVDGLEFLHNKGFSHLDLKPTNVLIGSDMRLKIADFDSSHHESDSFVRGTGTANFRAPELKTDCKSPKAADVFSLGVMLFILVTGSHCFFEDKLVSGYNLLELILNQDQAYWRAVSACLGMKIKDESFKELFFSMVKRNPDERISLSEVKNSKWYRGPIYSDKEYKNVMSSFLL